MVDYSQQIKTTAGSNTWQVKKPMESLSMLAFLQSRITEEILKREMLPEVILCTNNYLAMGCIQSIRAEKLDVPGDIAIMTFDNYPFSIIILQCFAALVLYLTNLSLRILAKC